MSHSANGLGGAAAYLHQDRSSKIFGLLGSVSEGQPIGQGPGDANIQRIGRDPQVWLNLMADQL